MIIQLIHWKNDSDSRNPCWKYLENQLFWKDGNFVKEMVVFQQNLKDLYKL